MCTLSWLPVPGGYSLFFNRDESPLRGPEVPAAVHRWDDVTLVAPLDSDQGGTWIAANEFGVTVAVLNRYRSRDDPRDSTTQQGPAGPLSGNDSKPGPGAPSARRERPHRLPAIHFGDHGARLAGIPAGVER